jgi:hypothetical protein
MLYNQDWEKPKRDIHSLDSLIDWLTMKPRLGRYAYTSSADCLLAQYFTSMGLEDVLVGPRDYSFKDFKVADKTFTRANLPKGWDTIARLGILFGGTFGSALFRARCVRVWRSISWPMRKPQGRLEASSGSLGNIV